MIEGLNPTSLEPIGMESAQVLLIELASTFSSAPTLSRPDAPNMAARYRTLVEQIPAVTFMAFLDQGLSEAYVSPHVETVLGFSQEQWLNDPVRWYDQIHPDDRARWSIEAAQLIVSGRPLRSVYRVIARDGRVVWFHCQVKLVATEDGRPWFLHGVAFDITDLKEAETSLQEARDQLEARVEERTAELAQANRKLQQEVTERERTQNELAQAVEELTRVNADLEQFAYSASHDLQEPLRMVSIYSQILQEKFRDKLGASGEQFIDFVLTGAKRMEQLLADLRTFMQASATAKDSAQNADASEALSRALESLTIAIRRAGASITHGSLPRVCMHEFQLEQLFQNLIGNAIRYRSQEPPQILVAAERSCDEWIFSVQDNGVGIDPRFKEQIFGMFKRLHRWTDCPGTGMGLAICKRIVERAGGRIWVESELGRGSTFLFTVPAGDTDKP